MPNQNDIKLKSMLRKGTMLHGTYRVDGYLSSGGFGNTYVATHVSFGKRYAIKEFFMDGVNERDNNSSTVKVSNDSKVDEFTGQRAKFYKEAQRLHNLDNRHIVRVHDLFDENGTTYYVMDYIDGENLRERLLRTGKPMSEQEVEDVLRQVLDALDEVHRQGLWHMDLKPANIMMDSKGVVKLIDFGASKQFNSDKGGAVSTSAVTYTNGYAPREQMEHNYQKFGPWTDFYALGATLYNLLSNRQPPMPSDIDDDRTPDKQHILPKPAGVSNHMWGLVQWMMNTYRMDRPQSVSDITSYLDADSEKTSIINDKTIIVDNQTNRSTDATKPARGVKESTKLSKQVKSVRKASLDKKYVVSKIALVKKSIPKLRHYFKVIAYAVIGGLLLFVVGYILLGSITKQSADESELAPDMVEITQEMRDSVLHVLEDNMVWVEGGTFMMGSTSEQGDDATYEEKPVHKVTLSGFYICKYEVTQELWQAVMRSFFNKSNDDLQCPVELSWEDCNYFIGQLNKLTGKEYRMLTEAEWENTARGGNHGNSFKYAGNDNLEAVAWYDENSDYTIHPVGTKLPNGLGLFDMSGNVSEWCADLYSSYSSESQTNPKGPRYNRQGYADRVVRGGGINSDASDCRVSSRHADSSSSVGHFGLRLARGAD